MLHKLRPNFLNRSIVKLLVLLILTSLGVLLLAIPGLAHDESAPITTVLSQGTLPNLPDGDLMFRIVDLTLNPGTPGVTHAHPAGAFYQIEGTQMLTIEDDMAMLQPGQGAWVDAGITHTHANDGADGMHFLFMTVAPMAAKGTPILPGFDVSFAAFESTPLKFTDRNTQDVTLSDIVFEAGQTSDLAPANGPMTLSVQDGKFAVELGDIALTMQKGDYVLVQPNTSVHIISDPNVGGHMLTLSVIPAS